MSGLSTESELLAAWDELAHTNELTVFWNPYQMLAEDLNKYNILNILNIIKNHNQIGHFVLLIKTTSNDVEQDFEYFDSYGIPPPMYLINHLQKIFNKKINVLADVKPIQPSSSKSCGYYAITKALVDKNGLKTFGV